MKGVVIILSALCVVVYSRQLLNEDQLLDELNYGTNVRSKRALCGAQRKPTRSPWITRDPVCLRCNCNGFPIISKRTSSAKIGGIWNPLCDSNLRRRCCYSIPYPGLTKHVASATDSASVKGMASNLIKLFGKRAGDSQFKKPSVDLVFLIDDSGSIPAAQFKVAKEGAATLSQALCPKTFGSGKGQKQVSAVLFSSTPQTVLTFSDSAKGAGFVENAILNLKQRSGGTATTDAIKHVREKIVGGPGSRLNDPDTATIVFVITDGKCNDNCGALKQEAKILREKGPGVQVFAFGVGEADCDELEDIRGKDAGKVFGLPDFNFFEKLALAVKEQMSNNLDICVN